MLRVSLEDVSFTVAQNFSAKQPNATQKTCLHCRLPCLSLCKMPFQAESTHVRKQLPVFGKFEAPRITLTHGRFSRRLRKRKNTFEDSVTQRCFCLATHCFCSNFCDTVAKIFCNKKNSSAKKGRVFAKLICPTLGKRQQPKHIPYVCGKGRNRRHKRRLCFL